MTPEPCCDPDYSYEKGRYVHNADCPGHDDLSEINEKGSPMSDMKGEELISRAKAIEALEAKKEADDINPGGSVSPDWYWGTDCGLDAAIEILAALPVVPTDGRKTLIEMQNEVVAYEHLKGWQPNDNRFLESLALLHSEISEALEAHRDGDDAHVAEELADVFIRLLSTWDQFVRPLGYDLEREFGRKMEKNRGREWRHGGRTI
jgi:NTP pyrophosphatase (non-canonical NTP hydrolase)